MTVRQKVRKHEWYFISTSRLPLAVRRAFREEPNEAERRRGCKAVDIPISDEVVTGTVVDKGSSVTYEGYRYMKVVVQHNHTHDDAFVMRKL